MTDHTMDARTAVALSDAVAHAEANADEPRLLDALVETESNPPAPADLPTSPPAAPPASIPPAGHDNLVTGSQSFTVGWNPVRLTVRDPDRYEMHIYATSETATDWVEYAAEASRFAGSATCARLYSGQEIILKGYTGELWVRVPDSGVTGPVTVNYAAVTK